MTEITPRWEWRSFGRRFGAAEGRLARLTPSGVQESDEIYLLSPAGGNVKIRDALMDIKVLREVNADGLEQWTPVMKAGFPLPAVEAAKVLEALGLPVPTPLPASCTQDEFIAQFAAPGGAVRAVKVHKRRTRYTVGGCMAELSEVVANGKPTRTIAVESEDAAGVMRAVRELGLGGYTNTSYPRGLAALIDGAPERYAVIDAGTNSIKFHIAERDLGGRGARVVDRAEMTRLGEGLAQQAAPSSTPRSSAPPRPIAGMVDEAKRHGVRAIAAVGTAGLRIASNGNEVVAAIAGAHRRAHRGDLGRRGGPAGLRGRQGRPGVEPGLARRLRHRRRQFAVHLRARRQRRRALQRRCRCGALHRALPARPRGVAPRCCARPWRRSRPTSRASTAARRPTRWSRWAAR